MRAIFPALSVGLALMVMGTSASAVPFSYRFESQIVERPFGAFGAIGDPASITVTLDNGGMSDLSQVWTAADLAAVTFDINNGAATVSFFSPFDGGLSNAVGSFATDTAGNLISAPSNWSDLNVTADFAASFPSTNTQNWFINGGNPVLFDISLVPGPTTELVLDDAEGMRNPANWSRVTATALPLPPTLLLLIVGLGGLALLRRAGAARGFAEARGA